MSLSDKIIVVRKPCPYSCGAILVISDIIDTKEVREAVKELKLFIEEGLIKTQRNIITIENIKYKLDEIFGEKLC